MKVKLTFVYAFWGGKVAVKLFNSRPSTGQPQAYEKRRKSRKSSMDHLPMSARQKRPPRSATANRRRAGWNLSGMWSTIAHRRFTGRWCSITPDQLKHPNRLTRILANAIEAANQKSQRTPRIWSVTRSGFQAIFQHSSINSRGVIVGQDPSRDFRWRYQSAFQTIGQSARFGLRQSGSCAESRS